MQSASDLSFYIQQNILWNQLPSNIRTKLNNDITAYNKAVLNYCLQNQLRFRTSLISKITKNEKKYYEKLLQYSRNNMLLYPYHLQDIMVSGLRTTPFMYYIDMLCQIMSQEKSYDFIPNFTAADCLRLLNIGRNQYIDLMNNLRASNSATIGGSSSNAGTAVSVVNAGLNLIRRRTAASVAQDQRKHLVERIRQLLPTAPVESIIIEPWWLVSVGIVLEHDIETSSPATKLIIDHIIDQNGLVVAGTIDREELRRLYRRGMVYLDVPIEPSATVAVPTLAGFVMNRTTGDYFETLLYQIFVAIDENTTVDNLSTILQIPLALVQQAVSVFCRLQFANKRRPLVTGGIMHESWVDNGSILPPMSVNGGPPSELVNEMGTFLLDEGENESSGAATAASILDRNNSSKSMLTYSHSLFTMAASPNSTIGTANDNTSTSGIDPISSPALSVTQSVPSQNKKLAFIFDSSLTAFLMMGNLSTGLKNHAVTMFEVGKLSDESLDSLLVELRSVADVGEGEARRYYEHAVNLRHTIDRLRSISKHGVDLLRCGSLFGLDGASRTRMLTKNYRCLISMAPISLMGGADTAVGIGNSNCLSSLLSGDCVGSSSPFLSSRSELAISTDPELPHFGPVLPELTSVWFKLFLYSQTDSGPPSLLLAGGSRLRSLPKPLRRYSRLLITPWQQESVTVAMQCALVTINDALTHGPILVQGYELLSSNVTATVTPTERHLVFPIDETHPLEPKALRAIVDKLNDLIDLSNKCGFISYLQTPADNYGRGDDEEDDIVLLHIHFGVPLFDRDLNERVLDQLAKMELFSLPPDDATHDCINPSIDQYQKSTRTLAIRLLEFIDRYSSSNMMGSNCALNDDGEFNTESPSGLHQMSNRFGHHYCNEIALPTSNLFFYRGSFEHYLC